MDNYYDVISKLKHKCIRSKYKNEIKGNLELSKISKEYIMLILNQKKDRKSISTDSDKSILNEVDNLIFQKYWHKLKPFHQKIKLKEFINKSKIKHKNEIINKLNKAIDEKILTKKGSVNYDPFTYNITSIPTLDSFIKN
jgi:hypothetical protein